MKNNILPIIRVIACVLIATFLAQDVAWAYPDLFSPQKSSNNKLAVTGLQNKDVVSRLETVMIERAKRQHAPRSSDPGGRAIKPESPDMAKPHIKVESVYKDYFETIFDFNLKLLVLMAKRMNARRLSDAARSEKANADMQECLNKLWKEVKDFDERLKGLPEDLRMIDSHNRIKGQFTKAQQLIDKNDESAANAALMEALNIVSNAREEILRVKISRPSRKIKIRKEGNKIIMYQQRYIKPNETSKTTTPSYAETIFDLRWQAGRSLDEQEDGNANEREKISDYIKRIDQDQNTAETNAAELTTENIDYILLGLKGVKVEEKRLTVIALNAVKELIETDERSEIKYLLPIAKRYLELRIKGIDAILRHLKTGRAESFRDIVAIDNNDFIYRIRRINELLRGGDYNAALKNAYGLLRKIKPYLTEPDLEGIESSIWAAISSLSEAVKDSEMKSSSAFWLELTKKKIEDSQNLNEFMALFREEYIWRRLAGAEAYLKENTFVDIFERFIKDKQLIRGSPRTKAFQMLCYLAAFIPMEIKPPAKPSNKIPNPIFAPINMLRILADTDDIDKILTIKRLQKLSKMLGTLRQFSAKKYVHSLSLEERTLLIRAIAEDYSLTEQERFELAKAFAISKENLRKTAPLSKSQPNIAKEDKVSASSLDEITDKIFALDGEEIVDNKNEHFVLGISKIKSDAYPILIKIRRRSDLQTIGTVQLNIESTPVDKKYVLDLGFANINIKKYQERGIFPMVLALVSRIMPSDSELCISSLEETETLKALANGVDWPETRMGKILYRCGWKPDLISIFDRSGSSTAVLLDRHGKWPEFYNPQYFISILEKAIINIDQTDNIEEATVFVKLSKIKSDQERLPKPEPPNMEKKTDDIFSEAFTLGKIINNATPSIENLIPHTYSNKGIILYADDILERAAAADLAFTVQETNILENSTVVLYGRKPGRVELLKKIIGAADSNNRIRMVTLTPEDLIGRNSSESINIECPDEAEELETLLRHVRSRYSISNGNMLGVIKGFTNEAYTEGITRISKSEHVPVVSFADDKGIYSFKEAFAMLIAIKNDITPLANKEWFKWLRPIRKEDIERAYQDYRRVLEVAINA